MYFDVLNIDQQCNSNRPVVIILKTFKFLFAQFYGTYLQRYHHAIQVVFTNPILQGSPIFFDGGPYFNLLWNRGPKLLIGIHI